MKIFVKTLKGIHFQIEVNPHDTIGDVKKNIECVQGASGYPASQQMLIYQGRALTDATTLEENKIAENSFVVVMLCKSKIFSEESSVATAAMPTSNSKGSSKVTSVATAVTPASKTKNSSGESVLPAAAMPTSKSKSSSVESSVAAAAMPISKSKSSSKKSSVPAAPTPISKSKSSSGESSVATAGMPTSKCKSSSVDSSAAAAAEAAAAAIAEAAAAMPKTKIIGDCQIKSSPGRSSVAAPMPTSKGKSSSGDSSVAAPAMPTSKAPATPESPSVEECTTPPTPMTDASVPASVSTSVPSPTNASSASKSNVGVQAASNLDAENGPENTIQHILDMGGGSWDRDTVARALQAAFNNPERAVEYLCSGIPEQAEAGKPTNASAVSQQPTQPTTVPSSQPNAGPLYIFPGGLTTLGSDTALSGPLDFLRNSEKFQALRAMVQSNPETLQPMLQEFGKQNPNLMRLIREHQADFQRLLNEPIAGEQGNILEQYAAAMPQPIQVTPKEHAAIERLEAMGFDRSTVLEAYFACNKNEELTANYLLDHMHDFED